MFRSLAAAVVACGVVLGTPALARAQGWYGTQGQNNQGNQNWWWGQGGGGNHGQAPEPLTALGLSLGVAGIAAARLAASRKANRLTIQAGNGAPGPSFNGARC